MTTGSTTYDAIVVGGGHNGLVNAGYLAKAGLRTLVLEQNDLVGGAAITEELIPGFSFTTFSYALSLLRPEIIHELDLAKHGFVPLMMSSSFHPTGDGDYLLLGDDHDQNVQEIHRHSRHDADADDRYHHDFDRVVQAIQPLFDNAPPNAFGKYPEDQAGVAWLLDHLGSVEQEVMHVVVRLPPAARPTGWTTTSSMRRSRASTPPRVSPAPRSARCLRDPGSCCCSTRWASTTGTSARGRSTRAATAASPRWWPARPRRTRRDPHQRPGVRDHHRTAGPSASLSRTAPSSAPPSWS